MSPEFADLHNTSGMPDMSRVPATGQVENEPEAALWRLPQAARVRFGRGAINTMVLSPNGEHLAVGTDIGLWWYEVSTLSPIALWGTDCERILAIAFSASGEWVATGHEDGSIKVWDVQRGNCFTQVERQAQVWFMKQINQLAFSPDSQSLAASGPHDYIEHVAFAPCGNVIAGEREKEFILWGIESSKTLLTIPKPAELAYWWQGGIVFSPCGGYLATGLERVAGMASTPIKLWNTATGENVATFEGHLTHILSLAFSPDGTLLASGGYDGIILLWDTKSVIS